MNTISLEISKSGTKPSLRLVTKVGVSLLLCEQCLVRKSQKALFSLCVYLNMHNTNATD